MTESDNTLENIADNISNNISNNTATPAKRGYWAGFKDVKQLGRLFWVFVACYSVWALWDNVFDNAVFEFAEAQILKDMRTFNDYKFIFVIFVFMLLGSVVDWLGIRRSLIYIFGVATLLCCLAFAYLLFVDETPQAFFLIVFGSLFAIIGKIMATLEYKAIRRYVQQSMWPQATVLVGFVVNAATFPIAFFMFAPENLDFPGYALIIPILFFAFFIILVLKNFKQQNEFIDGTEDQLVKNDEPPIIVARPKNPFSGYIDVLKSDKIKQALLFSFSVLLLYFVNIGVQYITVFCFAGKERILLGESFPNSFVSLIWQIAMPVSILAVLVLFPILGRIKISLLIKTCALFHLVAALIFLIPTSDEILVVCSMIALLLVEIGDIFLGIFYFVYILKATPIGREGSMVAILGVVSLLISPLRILINKLISSERNADWTYAFTEAINIDASNAHALWLIVLVPVALGTLLLFVFNRYLFDEVV